MLRVPQTFGRQYHVTGASASADASAADAAGDAFAHGRVAVLGRPRGVGRVLEVPIRQHVADDHAPAVVT